MARVIIEESSMIAYSFATDAKPRRRSFIIESAGMVRVMAVGWCMVEVGTLGVSVTMEGSRPSERRGSASCMMA